jgi:transposase
LPTKKQTRPPNWTKREILDGIFYQLKNGCNWEDLPKDLPPYKGGILALAFSGGLKERSTFLMGLLHSQVREQVKKKLFGTTLMIIDSQAVKNTCKEEC